jgi:hypothetical protein
MSNPFVFLAVLLVTLFTSALCRADEDSPNPRFFRILSGPSV